MMILMLHILYQKHHLDLPKCLVENLMFFTSNISYILNAAANIFKGCGIFDLIFLSNMLLLLLTAANMFMSAILMPEIPDEYPETEPPDGWQPDHRCSDLKANYQIVDPV